MDPEIKIFGLTDPGRVYADNEDCFIAEIDRAGRHALCAAIDGIGGYEGGEIAAEIARRTICDYVRNSRGGRLLDTIKQALIEANNAIVREREANAEYSGMGCVATAAIIDTADRRLYLAHVGDSRLYQFHDGQLTKLSHDHSLVGYREEIGDLTEEEAMAHPRRNIIERSLGDDVHMFDDPNFIDAAIFPIPSGQSIYLFCSDGLSDMLTSVRISAILASGGSISEMARRLVEEANAAGGKDNITVVLAGISLSDHEQQESTDTCADTIDCSQSDPEYMSGRGRKGRWIWAVALAIVALLACLLYFYGSRFISTDRNTDIDVAPDSTVIIPVENSPDSVYMHPDSSDSIDNFNSEKDKTDSMP